MVHGQRELHISLYNTYPILQPLEARMDANETCQNGGVPGGGIRQQLPFYTLKEVCEIVTQPPVSICLDHGRTQLGITNEMHC